MQRLEQTKIAKSPLAEFFEKQIVACTKEMQIARDKTEKEFVFWSARCQAFRMALHKLKETEKIV